MSVPEIQHLWVRSAHCVACRQCELACARRHGVARIEIGRHALGVTLPAVCQHCEGAPCEASCISGAIGTDPLTRALTFEAERCVGCWSCAMVCPHAAVRRHARSGHPLSSRCDRCAGHSYPACVAACATGALQMGTTRRLTAELAGAGSPLVRLAKALLCLVVPLAGLGLGTMADDARLLHAMGEGAGLLLLMALLLPLIGRLGSGLLRRSVWAGLHVAVGTLAAAFALAHSSARFGTNVQTLAALSLYGLVLAGAAYRYLLPLWLQVSAAVDRASDSSLSPGLEAAAVSVSGRLRLSPPAHAGHWSGLMRTGAELLRACRPVHVIWGVLAAGLVVAHAVVMSTTGAAP